MRTAAANGQDTLHPEVVEGQRKRVRLGDQPTDAGLEVRPEPGVRIARASTLREHVHPVASEQSFPQKVHAGLIDATPADDRRGLSSGEEPRLERCSEEVD